MSLFVLHWRYSSTQQSPTLSHRLPTWMSVSRRYFLCYFHWLSLVNAPRPYFSSIDVILVFRNILALSHGFSWDVGFVNYLYRYLVCVPPYTLFYVCYSSLFIVPGPIEFVFLIIIDLLLFLSSSRDVGFASYLWLLFTVCFPIYLIFSMLFAIIYHALSHWICFLAYHWSTPVS